ncbi:hypothetical protein COOONC_11345 [Cooperia oncophora]
MLMFSFNKEEAVIASAASHLGAGVIGVILYFVFIFYDLSKWPFSANSALCNKKSVPGSDAGCFSDRFTWCDNLPQVSPFVSCFYRLKLLLSAFTISTRPYGNVYYTMFVLVFGFGVSIMNIAITTLYSEVIGPRRQSEKEHTDGDDLMDGFLYTAFGPQAPWLLDVALICLIIASWLIFRKKMVPLESRIIPKISSTKEES